VGDTVVERKVESKVVKILVDIIGVDKGSLLVLGKLVETGKLVVNEMFSVVNGIPVVKEIF